MKNGKQTIRQQIFNFSETALISNFHARRPSKMVSKWNKTSQKSASPLQKTSAQKSRKNVSKKYKNCTFVKTKTINS